MSLHALAGHMASKGRGTDSMLVHMTPEEVQSLQVLALKGGGTLTINPDTGLPEANFLKKMLPMIAGAALNFFAPGLGTAVGGMFGLGAAAGTGIAVGGISALATGSLSRGLMAGMGAYGGASLAGGLAGAGAGAAQDAAMAGLSGEQLAQQALTSGLTEQGVLNQAAANATTDFLAKGAGSQLAQGATAAFNNPSSFIQSMGGPAKTFGAAYAAASPMMADEGVQTTTKMPDTGTIRNFTFDPYGQTYTNTGNYPASEYQGRGMAQGGIVALAAGGTSYRDLTKDSTADQVAAAYKQFTSTRGGDTQENQAAALSFLGNLGIGQDTINQAYSGFQASPTFNTFTNEEIGGYLRANPNADIAAATQQFNADPRAVNQYISSLGEGFLDPTATGAGSGSGQYFDAFKNAGIDAKELFAANQALNAAEGKTYAFGDKTGQEGLAALTRAFDVADQFDTFDYDSTAGTQLEKDAAFMKQFNAGNFGGDTAQQIQDISRLTGLGTDEIGSRFTAVQEANATAAAKAAADKAAADATAKAAADKIVADAIAAKAAEDAAAKAAADAAAAKAAADKAAAKGGSGLEDKTATDAAAAKAAADKAAADKVAADKAIADKIAADKAAADKAAADKAAADKAAADKLAADKAVADKAVADKLAADRVASDAAARKAAEEAAAKTRADAAAKAAADKAAADAAAKIAADKAAADAAAAKVAAEAAAKAAAEKAILDGKTVSEAAAASKAITDAAAAAAAKAKAEADAIAKAAADKAAADAAAAANVITSAGVVNLNTNTGVTQNRTDNTVTGINALAANIPGAIKSNITTDGQYVGTTGIAAPVGTKVGQGTISGIGSEADTGTRGSIIDFGGKSGFTTPPMELAQQQLAAQAQDTTAAQNAQLDLYRTFTLQNPKATDSDHANFLDKLGLSPDVASRATSLSGQQMKNRYYDAKYNTMTGDSAAAFDFLRGRRPNPIKSSAEQIMRPYSEAVMGIPAAEGRPNQKFIFDQQTRRMISNPNYVPMSFNSKGERVTGVSDADFTKGFDALKPAETQANFDYNAYLKANPDVQSELDRGVANFGTKSDLAAAAFNHYTRFGKNDGRAFTMTPGAKPDDAAIFEYADANNITDAQLAIKMGIPIAEVASRRKKFKTPNAVGSGSLFDGGGGGGDSGDSGSDGDGSGTGSSGPGGSSGEGGAAAGGAGPGGPGDGPGDGDGTGYAYGGRTRRMALGGLGALARGGATSQYNLGGYSDGGRLLRGPGDGVSDSIPATIGNRQPARLADGEFVVPARIVSELGNGSTEAGARKLYAMMDRVQKARGKTTGKNRVAANTRSDKFLPA